MKEIDLEDVTVYVEANIVTFHDQRLKSLDKLRLNDVLKNKNPYLFKAKNMTTASDIVKAIVDAHLSSSEEGTFGDFLEGLAIFINQQVYGGIKSGIRNIDLEFVRDEVRYLVSIKSGPKWGNASQQKKLVLDFQTALKTIKTSGNHKINVVCINGCCYGKSNAALKDGIYYKYSGQKFWEFISGNRELYTQIIAPLGSKAEERNLALKDRYDAILNLFTKEFLDNFCKENGEIDWDKIVQFNSGEITLKLPYKGTSQKKK